MLFTDGRDTNPDSGIRYLREFESKAREIGVGQIASVIGRYYAMDRDNRWERVERAYRLMVDGVGTNVDSATKAFEMSYAGGFTDEFIEPYTVGDSKDSRIAKNDTVLFFNFRGDRAREITRALHEDGFTEFKRNQLNLNYYSFTQYDEKFTDVQVVFEPASLENTLGKVISKAGLRQLRIAETEKYPHVTYFFNGGEETPNAGEERIVVPSPKVATYDLKPEMSAYEVTDKLCSELETGKFDFVALNFANPDMVGHTGVMSAAIKAIETIDICMQRVVTTAQKNHYDIVVIADHGNADIMVQEDGSPHTAHTLAMVPCVIISSKIGLNPRSGVLADVAPTILKLMGIPQPVEMTGNSLI
jgi:2,3-bisphosphoglycerate-independent phosphoglycerate mutase